VFYEQGEGGLTPLHISVMAGDEDMVKLLHSFKASASVPDKVRVDRNLARTWHTVIIIIIYYNFKCEITGTGNRSVCRNSLESRY